MSGAVTGAGPEQLVQGFVELIADWPRVERRPSEAPGPHRARPAYDRWRDTTGTHIPDGCQVEQVEVDRDRGALRWRLHHQGEVIGRGRGSRLHVRFDGETMPVSIRPHLVRILTIDAGQSVGQLEQLHTPLPAHTPPEQALSAGSCDG